MKVTVAVLLLAMLAYLLAWPVPIDPAAWTPPPALELPANSELRGIERIATNHGKGPEAVNIDAQGRLVTGFIDGRVMRFNADGGNPELLADTRGRPLGIAFASDGSVLIADAVRGLLSIPPESAGASGKDLRVLATGADGIPFGFADDLDVSADDVVYMSDASVKFGVHQVRTDFFEHRPNGRLIRHDLKSGETSVLLPALYFANGVALGPDDAFVLVNETARYRVLRHWLKGERAGQTETFIDALPGFPDNITFNGRDRFWLALYAPRSEDLDKLLPKPFLRKLIMRLPEALQPAPVMYSYALGLNVQAGISHNLQYGGPDAYAPITSVREGGKWLYFGSLSAPSLARMPLPGN